MFRDGIACSIQAALSMTALTRRSFNPVVEIMLKGLGHRQSSPEPFKELLADAVAAAQATKFVEADQTRSLNDFGSWYP